MKFFLLTCFLLTALMSGALTAPVTTPAPADSPCTEETPAPMNTTSSSGTEATMQSDLSASGYNCSAPSEGVEFKLAVGYLQTGLDLLFKYSQSIQDAYRTNIDLDYLANCGLGSLKDQYDDLEDDIWTSIALLEGYAVLCEAALSPAAAPLSQEQQDYMRGAKDVLRAVIADYKTVLASQHCECNQTTTCSDGATLDPVPSISGPHCKHFPYIAENLLGEVQHAFYNIFRQTAQAEGFRRIKVSSDQWVANRLGDDSPAYSHFQT